MGFNFRKSIKIAPGVRLNVGKKGISSVSLGGKGSRVNISKKGTRTTVGVPGTGLSYSSFQPKVSRKLGDNSTFSDRTNQIIASISGCCIIIFLVILAYKIIS